MDSKGNVTYKEIFKEYKETFCIMAVTKRSSKGFAELFQLIMTANNFEEAKSDVELLLAAGDENPADIIIIPTKEAVDDKIVPLDEDKEIESSMSPEDWARLLRVYYGTGSYM